MLLSTLLCLTLQLIFFTLAARWLIGCQSFGGELLLLYRPQRTGIEEHKLLRSTRGCFQRQFLQSTVEDLDNNKQYLIVKRRWWVKCEAKKISRKTSYQILFFNTFDIFFSDNGNLKECSLIMRNIGLTKIDYLWSCHRHNGSAMAPAAEKSQLSHKRTWKDHL